MLVQGPVTLSASTHPHQASSGQFKPCSKPSLLPHSPLSASLPKRLSSCLKAQSFKRAFSPQSFDSAPVSPPGLLRTKRMREWERVPHVGLRFRPGRPGAPDAGSVASSSLCCRRVNASMCFLSERRASSCYHSRGELNKY